MAILPIGSMYGIYANIGGILMVNVTIYSIHGSYGLGINTHCHGQAFLRHQPQHGKLQPGLRDVQGTLTEFLVLVLSS